VDFLCDEEGSPHIALVAESFPHAAAGVSRCIHQEQPAIGRLKNVLIWVGIPISSHPAINFLSGYTVTRHKIMFFVDLVL
jgi:hypothetical protein